MFRTNTLYNMFMNFINLHLLIYCLLCINIIKSFDDNMDPNELMNMMGGSQGERLKPYTKYFDKIQCQVCEESIKQIARQSKNIISTKKKDFSEDDLFILLENTCDPYSDQGEWITYYDLVSQPPKLLMKKSDTDEIGECRRECETIAYVCDKIFNKHNVEIVELLYKQSQRSEIRNEICTSYCKKEKHNVKATDKIGQEKWIPVDEERRTLVKMKKQMPGNVKMVDPMNAMMDGMYDNDYMEQLMQQQQQQQQQNNKKSQNDINDADWENLMRQYAENNNEMYDDEMYSNFPNNNEQTDPSDIINNAWGSVKNFGSKLFGGWGSDDKKPKNDL